MNRKMAAIWLSFTITIGFIMIVIDILPNATAQSTIYVDDVPGSGGPGDPPEDYTSIQDAINAANPGDTIFVYNGTYDETLYVDQTINLTGENRNTTIIDGSSGFGENVIYVTSSWVNITGFTITGGDISGECGIRISSSSNNNTIKNNNITNNEGGIQLSYTSNNIIMNNILFDNPGNGISLYESPFNIIKNNNISFNTLGILVERSLNNSIFNNVFTKDGIFINGDEIPHFNSHYIPTNNNVSGKPLYYYKNSKNFSINGDVLKIGQLIIANCSDIKIMNLQINSTDSGMEVAFSNNISIRNSNISSNGGIGIYYIRSSNNTAINNTISSNGYGGIKLMYSSNITIIGNKISLNWDAGGVALTSSSNNCIRSNNISSNRGSGISLGNSQYNIVINNEIYNNTQDGIYSQTSSNNTISFNNISSNSGRGMYFVTSSDNTITRNIIYKNKRGVSIGAFTANNKVYHNNIINNTIQASDDRTNLWDNGYPYGGNYWSNYNGVDNYKGPDQDILGSDGIGDTNYSIDLDSVDHYPLIAPIENYIFLYHGWNLISIPRIQPEKSIGTVLSSLSGSYDTLQWYNVSDTNDHWKHNHTSKPPGLNDLDTLDHTMGFWIHINEPGGALYVYPGTQPSFNQSITLHPGWNMVGYPSLSNKNRTTALNNLTLDSDIDVIWTYDAISQKWEEMGESDYFEIGKGYYIHSKVKKTWEVPL